MSSDFSYQTSEVKDPDVKLIHLAGELDEVSIEKLRAYVDPLLEDKSMKKLIFDLEKLEFINSKGIGYLVSVHTHLSRDGRTLVIAGAVEPVMDVISLVGLTSIIPYFSTVDDALNG